MLLEKNINRDLFKRVMEQVWGVVGKVEFEKLADNVFIFNFNNMEDRNRVWVRGPWHFDRSLIVMEKLDGVGDIANLYFNKTKMWIQLHNLPLILRNRKMIKLLVEKIGRAVEIPLENRECSGRFVRVKVVLDIRRPLRRELKLALEGFEGMVVIPLRYEKLPDFCFACGKIGHVWRDCTDEETKKDILEGGEVKFGSWLRASAERNIGGKQEVIKSDADKLNESFREAGQATSEGSKQGGGSKQVWSEQGADSEVSRRRVESRGPKLGYLCAASDGR